MNPAGWVWMSAVVGGAWAVGRPEPRLRCRRGRRSARDPVAAVGSWCRGRLHRPPAPAADRRVGRAVCPAAPLVLVHPVAAVVVGVAVWSAPVLGRRRSRRSHREALAAELPWVAGLVRLGVGAGLPIDRALAEAARRGDGPASRALAAAMDRTTRGVSLAEAVADLRVALGQPGRPFVAALAGSIRMGAPIGPALDAASAELRADSRRRAEIRARKVPVRMLFPLALCILPAFVLLSVAPMVLDALDDLQLDL